MILYRPVGTKELELIAETDFREFPPRLPGQPIFYPVLNFDYAAQIARDWNATDPATGYVGYVLCFEIDDDYASQFQVHTVGGRQHQELWAPAEELKNFNRHILGKITVEATFYGPGYKGEPQ